MIDDALIVIYRLIVLGVLGGTVWSALDEEDGTVQATAALLVIPLVLRLFMIK
jgi:membrane protein DedA with SNARE-associated domain